MVEVWQKKSWVATELRLFGNFHRPLTHEMSQKDAPSVCVINFSSTRTRHSRKALFRGIFFVDTPPLGIDLYYVVVWLCVWPAAAEELELRFVCCRRRQEHNSECALGSSQSIGVAESPSCSTGKWKENAECRWKWRSVGESD